MFEETNAAPAQRGLDDLHQALQVWMQEVEQTLDADGSAAPWLREPPPPVFGQSRSGPFAFLHAGPIAAAALDRNGEIHSATDAFLRGAGPRLLRGGLKNSISAARAMRMEVVGDGAESFVVALAPAGFAEGWRLPSEIHEQARMIPDGVVMVGADIGDRAQPLRAACLAYGLTDLQTRVCVDAIRAGGIKKAAATLGLSYQTARETLAAAMKRVGVERLPALVGRLTTLAFGVLPGQATSAALLADVWGLTERQIAVAGLIAEGLSRREVAEALQISEAVTKKELEATFSVLRVTSAAALARKIVEARAFAWLTQHTLSNFGYLDDTAEPLRFSRRADGTQVAWSDYGPASGRPVLIVHSSMTTRIVSRKLLRALHAAGFRPIAIDRPGFGLSEPLKGPPPVDPWRAAAADVSLVLSQLRLRTIDVVSRGGAQFVAALHEELAARIGRVVVVNPGPPYRYSGKGNGPLGLIKDALLSNPEAAQVLAPFLAGHLTHARLTRIMEQWMRGSAPDHAAVQDLEIANDFYRSVRMFAAGHFEGFIAEQAAIARGVRPAPLRHAAWRVILGCHDVLHDPDAVLTYWREMLPEGRFQIVADGGRFLAMTHPDLVVRALQLDA